MTIHVCLGKTVSTDLVEPQARCDDTDQKNQDLDELRKICGSSQTGCDQGCCEKRTFTWQVDNDFLFHQAGDLSDSEQKHYTDIRTSNNLPYTKAAIFFNLYQPNAPPLLVENKRILHQSFLL
jgi:hypothetical protein